MPGSRKMTANRCSLHTSDRATEYEGDYRNRGMAGLGGVSENRFYSVYRRRSSLLIRLRTACIFRFCLKSVASKLWRSVYTATKLTKRTKIRAYHRSCTTPGLYFMPLSGIHCYPACTSI